LLDIKIERGQPWKLTPPVSQEAFLTTADGWAAVSAGPLQERRSRLAQRILPNKIR
jgi:hypothetical protein